MYCTEKYHETSVQPALKDGVCLVRFQALEAAFIHALKCMVFCGFKIKTGLCGVFNSFLISLHAIGS